MAVTKPVGKKDATTKLKALQASGKLSKNAKKKASKLRRKALTASYCWYCASAIISRCWTMLIYLLGEREFEDDKGPHRVSSHTKSVF